MPDHDDKAKRKREWTGEENEIVRSHWNTGAAVNEWLHLLPGRTRNSVASHAINTLKLAPITAIRKQNRSQARLRHAPFAVIHSYSFRTRIKPPSIAARRPTWEEIKASAHAEKTAEDEQGGGPVPSSYHRFLLTISLFRGFRDEAQRPIASRN